MLLYRLPSETPSQTSPYLRVIRVSQQFLTMEVCSDQHPVPAGMLKQPAFWTRLVGISTLMIEKPKT